VTQSSSAACVKLNCLAAASNARKGLSGGIFRLMRGAIITIFDPLQRRLGSLPVCD